MNGNRPCRFNSSFQPRYFSFFRIFTKFIKNERLCAPHRVVICVTSLQEWLGLTTKDADFSAVWLTRDQFGLTFLDQLGLMDMSDLLELSKGLSKIGAKICESLWLKFRTSKSPFSFLDKLGSGA